MKPLSCHTPLKSEKPQCQEDEEEEEEVWRVDGRSSVYGGGGSRILSSGHHPASRATNAQLTPAECSSFFLYFPRYVSGARCVPKRITYTAGAFSIA